MFIEPPRIDLVTGEGFSGIEIDDNSIDMTVLLASVDVDNCFHRMRLGSWLRHYFCWPPLPAATLGISKLLHVPLSPEDLVYPLPHFLPMGFSWAPFLAQTANRSQTGLKIPGGSALTGGAPGLSIRRNPV